VREEINEVYHANIQAGVLSQKKTLNDLVNHGPEVRNPSENPPDYPWIESTGLEITQGPPEDPHQNLRKYLQNIRREGQFFEIPDHWKTYLSE
jgi:hypothetical protein